MVVVDLKWLLCRAGCARRGFPVFASVFASHFRIVGVAVFTDGHELVPTMFAVPEILPSRLKALLTPSAKSEFVWEVGGVEEEHLKGGSHDLMQLPNALV